MPSDRDRDTTDIGVDGPLPPRLVAPAVSADIAAERMTPERRGGPVDRRHAPSDRVGSSSRTSWPSSAWSSSSSWCLFCWLGPVFYHTNQTNAQEALVNSTSNAAAERPTPAWAPTTPASTSSVGSCSAERTRSSWASLAAILGTVFGALYGAVSGFFGGWVDALMMRIVDILLSIPPLFLLIVLAVIFHPSLTVLILVIAFVSWLVPARLIRGETLTLRVREYVQAVRVMGGSRRRIVLRHIIPNAIGTIIVNATFQVADAILFLAALGFLGLGVQPPQTDWGSMLSNGVNYAIQGYWWEIYPAGLAIVLVVVAFNFIGDALRDSLEVRLQQR